MPTLPRQKLPTGATPDPLLGGSGDGAAGGPIHFNPTRPEGIPEALRAIPQWLAYRAEEITKPDGTRKLNKVPTNARTGRNGKSNDPATWGTFQEVAEYTRRAPGLVGMGFAFTTEAGVIAIDLDHCVDESGEVHPEALALLGRFPGAWVELSPSGTGLHLWMRGRIDGLTSLKRPPVESGYPFGVELFGNRYFMTVTGLGCDDGAVVADLPDLTGELVKLHKELGGTHKRGRAGATPTDPPPAVFDVALFEAEVIAKLPDAGPRESYVTPEGVEAVRWEVDCPNKAAHTGGGDTAALLFFPEGGPRFKCLHAHCAGIHWEHFAEARGVKWTSPALAPIEAARAGTPYPMTDLGNAERLVAYHGDAVRWDVARKVWRAWDGRRWAVDSALQVQRRASDAVRRIRKEATAAPSNTGTGKDTGAALFAHAVKSESRDRLAAMIEVAKSLPGIAVAAADLDADPWVLNVLNGTLDLRTGTLRPHDRADLITKLAPVEYRPGCRCERLERFLASACGGDPALVAFLQVVAGYTLTGDTSEEKLFLVYGPEASGKTTFLEMLRAALGEYARTVQADLLTKARDSRGGGAASPELAALAGARMAAGSEMEQGRELAEALAKNLTGGEHITARHLYAEHFDFAPQFKLWLALNHLPRVSADDGAIWRRILRIGFEHTVPAGQRDKTLKPYLRDPNGGAPAVLAWAVEGCLRWQREGLVIPEAVSRSTSAYRAESDPLATFMEDALVFNPDAWTPWGDVWAAYNEHAAENGTPERYRVAPKRLQERLRGRGCESAKRYAGRGWSGVELAEGWKTPDHGGHGGHGTIPKTFSHEELLEKVCEVPPLPPCPPCTPKNTNESGISGTGENAPARVTFRKVAGIPAGTLLSAGIGTHGEMTEERAQ
jgi:putative DNA primase/helicase